MLAHQGGWDEILWVLVPIGFIAFLLQVANVRAKRLPGNRPVNTGTNDDPSARGGPVHGHTEDDVSPPANDARD